MASVSVQLDCTVGVQEQQMSLCVQAEKANVPAAQSFLFLKNVCVLTSVHHVYPNQSLS